MAHLMEARELHLSRVMPPSSRRNLALLDAPTKRYDRKAILSTPPFCPAPENDDDFAPTLSGGRGYERLIGRERVASVVARHEDVLATRELPRIDATLLRASLPSSPDLDQAATNERPRAKLDATPTPRANGPLRIAPKSEPVGKPRLHVAAEGDGAPSLRALAPLLGAASVEPSRGRPHEPRGAGLRESFDPREAETAERPLAVLVSADPPTARALVDVLAAPSDEPSFPIHVEIEEPAPSSGQREVAAPPAREKPRKNKLRRALSVSATVVGLAAIVACVVLALRSPEAKVRFPAGFSVASEAVVRFARSAVDVAVRGVRRIHANVEVSS